MYDIISIGSSLVDIFIQASGLEKGRQNDQQILTYGDKVELDDFHVFSGGGASNTAVAFARLGLQTAVIAETGRDEFARIIVEDFQQEGVATNLLVQEKLERTGGSLLLVAKDGERIALTYRGAAASLDPYDIPAFWLAETPWIHLSNSGANPATLQKIFQTVAKSQQSKLSWNPGKKELLLLAEQKIDPASVPCEIFLVNQEEWQLVAPLQAQLIEHFPQVVITKGKAGGEVYLYGRRAFAYEGQALRLVDSTGAGDAFAAAYVAASFLGYDVPTAITWGVKNASNVIAYYGAKTGLLHRDQIIELSNKSSSAQPVKASQ